MDELIQRFATKEKEFKIARGAIYLDTEREGTNPGVEFVAIGASQIASADGNDVCEERVPRRHEAFHNHAHFAEFAVRREQFSPNFLLSRHLYREQRQRATN